MVESNWLWSSGVSREFAGGALARVDRLGEEGFDFAVGFAEFVVEGGIFEVVAGGALALF